MNIGLVVEGPSDRAAYPALLRRIRNDISQLQVRECSGKSGLKGKFPSFLREFDRNPAWQIDAALVIQDSDCNPSQQITERLQGALRGTKFVPDFRVEFLVPKCDLETWLLVDEGAINQAAQQRGKPNRVEHLVIEFESDRNAKRHFWAQLSKAGLSPVPEVYGQIASLLDIERTALACPSFRHFVNRVRAC